MSGKSGNSQSFFLNLFSFKIHWIYLRLLGIIYYTQTYLLTYNTYIKLLYTHRRNKWNQATTCCRLVTRTTTNGSRKTSSTNTKLTNLQNDWLTWCTKWRVYLTKARYHINSILNTTLNTTLPVIILL